MSNETSRNQSECKILHSLLGFLLSAAAIKQGIVDLMKNGINTSARAGKQIWNWTNKTLKKHQETSSVCSTRRDSTPAVRILCLAVLSGSCLLTFLSPAFQPIML